jgi:hypothetical protein
MFFGRSNKRRVEPVARPTSTPADNARGLIITANGPDTPVMDVAAMRKALNHAAWRDPWVERRKGDIIQNAVRTLERTAACVDLASERLNEAFETLTQGKSTTDQIMRGLLTARFEELLDSLERIVVLAQDGQVNLLSGVPSAIGQESGARRTILPSNGLSLDIGSAGFSYVLTPIDVRRGHSGLGISVLQNGFQDDAETYGIETSLIKAQAKLAQFADRLSHDATMLVRIARDNEDAKSRHENQNQLQEPSNTDDSGAMQTDCENAA